MPDPTDEPLIWTTKGNVPLSSLRYETAWQHIPGERVVFRETHYLGDEMVKQSVHVLKLEGLTTVAEQGQLPT